MIRRKKLSNNAKEGPHKSKLLNSAQSNRREQASSQFSERSRARMAVFSFTIRYTNHCRRAFQAVRPKRLKPQLRGCAKERADASTANWTPSSPHPLTKKPSSAPAMLSSARQNFYRNWQMQNELQ